MRLKRTVKATCIFVLLMVALWLLLPAVNTNDPNDIEMHQNIAKFAKNLKHADLRDDGESQDNSKNKLANNGGLVKQEGVVVADNRDGRREGDLGGKDGEGGREGEIDTPERNTSHHLNIKDNSRQSNMIKQAMLTINHEQKIHNIDRFPQRPEDSIVILVMVHDRLEYLEYLIESLRKAGGISNALLIFSHDYYSEDINRVVSKVNFCQMMQIFYPYSLQVYENEFPGQDPKDCPRDITMEKAKNIKCNNWEHPDSYGHYREVRYVMTKHHWFWKLQYVFADLESTRNHQGLVLLLEEDHYVAPDFYVMLQKMYQLKKEKSPGSDILTLGAYDKNFFYRDRNNNVGSLIWQSSKHNMGMSLDRQAWNKLQACVETFCTYDDYNWDWTLNYISHKCLPSPLQVLLFMSPRIFHIGECGIHHKGKGKCSAGDLVAKINGVLTTNADLLFPDNLVLSPKTKLQTTKLPKPNGGWGDVRDHTLCKTYGHSVKRL